MQEKKKQPIENPSPGPSGFGFDDGSSDSQSVNVGSGGYNENLPVAGKTVGEIRKKFKTLMEIDDAAVPVINGKDADEDSIVELGAKLQFIHKAGEKGMKTYSIKLTAEEMTVIAFSLGTAIGTLHKQAQEDPTSKPSTKFMENCNAIMGKINEAKGEA